METAILTMLSMVIGIFIGQRLSKGETPIPNPIKVYKEEIIEPLKEIKHNRELEESFSKDMAILDNINSYKGNSRGQKRVE